MQPTVYADKPLQIALKMSGLQNILFDGFDENGRRIVKTIKAHELNAFNVNVLNQLLEATYESTREEHRLYFNYVSEAYRGFANYLSQKYNVPVDLNQDFTKLFEFAKAAIGTNDFAVEFNLFAETQSYPLIRRLLFEKGRGQYKLNNTLVGTFIKYNFIGPKNDRFTMDHKLGIIDFLSDIVKYEINHKDSNLKLFNDSTDSLSAELGKLDKAQLKILQSEIQDRVLKNDRTIYDDQTLSTKISKFLEGVGTPYLQYYWEHTLYSENTKLSVTGPTYLHPASDLEKIQDLGKETLYTEEALRIAQQQKRNVSLSSTTKPYKYGISGPARVKNIFVMKEPKDKLTNPLGEETNWDIEDGGEHILLHHRLLENDSL
jgi:hypothetical protein